MVCKNWRRCCVNNKNEGQIILYLTSDGKIKIDVRFEDETFWLSQKLIAELFEVDRSVITKHLNNIFNEEELDRDSTCAKFAQVQNENELFRMNRIVTMFIDYAELMAEDEVLMSMADWLKETDNFLTSTRRKVLEGKGTVSHEDAVKKAEDIYKLFRIKQDKAYISDFDRDMAKYYKGEDEGGAADE